jgi:hypothetical protein
MLGVYMVLLAYFVCPISD